MARNVLFMRMGRRGLEKKNTSKMNNTRMLGNMKL